VGLGRSLALPRGFAEVRGVERQGRWLACGFGVCECGRAWRVRAVCAHPRTLSLDGGQGGRIPLLPGGGEGDQRRRRGRRNQSSSRTTATAGRMGFRRGRNHRISPSTNRRSGRRKAQAAGRVRVGKQVQSAARTMPIRRQAAGHTEPGSANTRPKTPPVSSATVAIPVRRRRSASSE